MSGQRSWTVAAARGSVARALLLSQIAGAIALTGGLGLVEGAQVWAALTVWATALTFVERASPRPCGGWPLVALGVTVWALTAVAILVAVALFATGSTLGWDAAPAAVGQRVLDGLSRLQLHDLAAAAGCALPAGFAVCLVRGNGDVGRFALTTSVWATLGIVALVLPFIVHAREVSLLGVLGLAVALLGFVWLLLVLATWGCVLGLLLSDRIEALLERLWGPEAPEA